MANDLTAIRQELDAITKLIAETVPVERIYLFGSYAYGTPHKYSDLDFYVVLKDDAPMRDIDAGLQISLAIARKKTMPVDIIVKKQKEYLERKENPTLERRIDREGVVVYG